jgi:hypothetical protein
MFVWRRNPILNDYLIDASSASVLDQKLMASIATCAQSRRPKVPCCFILSIFSRISVTMAEQPE